MSEQQDTAIQENGQNPKGTPIIEIIRFTHGQPEIRIRAAGRRRLTWANDVLRTLATESMDEHIRDQSQAAGVAIKRILTRLDKQGRLGPVAVETEQ